MKTTLSILIATLILANAASAAPGNNDYAATTKPAYDDGSWYPGKYPGDPTDKKHKDYKSDGHGDGYGSANDHHSDDDGHHSDHDHDHSDHDDHHADGYYGGGQQHYPASPYDYAPKGRARSYSRSRERVNQWHDVNGSGYGHTYTRNWHGQGQGYYRLQRRGAPAEEGARGRTLVRRGEAEKPALEKRGDYDYDSHHTDNDGYSTGHDSDHHSDHDHDHDHDHQWRPRRWRPRPRPYWNGYGNGYGHGNGYYRLMKRDLAAEEQPALEKRSGGYYSGNDDHHTDHDDHHSDHDDHHTDNDGYSTGHDSDHHSDHDHDHYWRPRPRPRPYWNGYGYGQNYGHGHGNGYYRLMKRDLANEEKPVLEKRSGGYNSGYDSDHHGPHHHRRWRPHRRFPRYWWPSWNNNYYWNGYY